MKIENWKEATIGEVATIIGGGTPSTLNPSYWNGDIQWFTPAELNNSKKYVSKSERTITEQGLKESSAKLLPKGTVLLTTRASIGLTAILKNPACTNQGFQSLIAKDICCNEFLYYVIPLIKDEMLSRASGSTFAEISARKLSTITLQLPPLPEQQRIAKALSDVDALISTTEKLIQKKKNIKQGTMQNLLTGKKRLPGFGDKQTDLFVPNGTHTKEVKDVSPEQIRLSAKMKQTELGEIPEDWEVKSIKDFAKVYDGTHQTPHYVDVGIPFYSVENVTANDFEHTKLISEKEHRLLTSKVKIEKGNILMTRIGSIGDCKYIDWEPEASFYVSLALIKCDTSVDARFISYYSNSLQFKKELELRSLITAIPQKINLGPISEIILVLPPKEEQTAIANVLSSMDKEIETLNTKLEKYRNLKTAMMQQLLTGKIRLV